MKIMLEDLDINMETLEENKEIVVVALGAIGLGAYYLYNQMKTPETPAATTECPEGQECPETKPTSDSLVGIEKGFSGDGSGSKSGTADSPTPFTLGQSTGAVAIESGVASDNVATPSVVNSVVAEPVGAPVVVTTTAGTSVTTVAKTVAKKKKKVVKRKVVKRRVVKKKKSKKVIKAAKKVKPKATKWWPKKKVVYKKKIVRR